MPQITFNLDQTDDAIIGDTTPSFRGGQVSNERANLINQDACARLINCDLNKFGRLTTRKGTIQHGASFIESATPVQGLTFYRTATDSYLVAAHKGKIWKWTDPTWTQIAMGGIQHHDDITFIRVGYINNAGGYLVGDTVLTVDGFTGAPAKPCTVEVGQKLYFGNNRRTDYYEYTIAGSALGTAGTANDTVQITLEEPGLVFPVYDNWTILVKQTAQVNNVAGYAGGTTTIVIDNYLGVVKNGEYFRVDKENIPHLVSAHLEPSGNTTSVTFAPVVQYPYQSTELTERIIFAQGNDNLYWCDGIGAIYGWDGIHTTNLERADILDVATGSTTGDPPDKTGWLVWFQNRLIAADIGDEPDAVYFSDYLDPATWDSVFQQIRIGGGESDPVLGMVGWTDLNLVILKQHSIYVVNCDPSQNQEPSDPTQIVSSFAIKLVNRHVGCPAPMTAVQVGGGGSIAAGDIFFLSDSGVRSLKRTIAAENQQEIGEALSFPVKDIIDRINRTYIHRSVAFYHENRYLLAVPLDNATQPNYVLVFNTLTESWTGLWTGWLPTAFSVEPQVSEVSRMVFGQSTGTVRAWLDDVELDSETDDTFEDNGVAIPTQVLTRAYTAGDFFCRKTGLNAEIECVESTATVAVQVVLDGVTMTGVPMPGESVLDPTGGAGTAAYFDSDAGTPIILPVVLPFTLPSRVVLFKAFDLQQYEQWRELQLLITTTAKKLGIRSIRIGCWYDTLQIQS